jgi:hypothetical protein
MQEETLDPRDLTKKEEKRRKNVTARSGPPSAEQVEERRSRSPRTAAKARSRAQLALKRSRARPAWERSMARPAWEIEKRAPLVRRGEGVAGRGEDRAPPAAERSGTGSIVARVSRRCEFIYTS